MKEQVPKSYEESLNSIIEIKNKNKVEGDHDHQHFEGIYHRVRERLNAFSTKRFCEFLCQMLNNIM